PALLPGRGSLRSVEAPAARTEQSFHAFRAVPWTSSRLGEPRRTLDLYHAGSRAATRCCPTRRAAIHPPSSMGYVDLHSHVLFGLDDGSPDRSTSLAMLDALAALGVTEQHATPHQKAGQFLPAWD